MATVHTSPYSGTWYTSDAAELKRQLDELFEQSEERTGPYLLPNGLGFVVPHAGLVYSGGVAAAAYRCLEAQHPERVIILGFSHRGGPAGVSIPEVDAIATPLGDVPIDRRTVEELSGDTFQRAPERSLCDHSVEIQLPLVQRAAPQARITPVYVGRLEAPVRRKVARRLAQLAGPGTVFLASSDFTHYGRDFYFQPFPPDSRVSDNLHKLDHAVIEAASSLKPELFLEELRKTGSNVCGAAPIALLLEIMAAVPAEEVFQETLDYQTSGEITGDFEHSVSYAALGYFPAESFHLTREDQRLLVESARRTLDRLLATGERRAVYPERRTPGLARRAGVFVTLHRNGELRGCVGCKSAGSDLYSTVPEMTLSAALDDVRFEPLSGEEGHIAIEISVLSPMKRITGPEQFRIKIHGGYLESGYYRGLLLPQVAEGRNWDAQQFLSALARKAGTSAKIYADPSTRLFVFRAQVFGEDLVS